MNFNADKVSNIHSKILDLLQGENFTIGELIILYGNLGYSIGASAKGYEGIGPNEEELKKLYYSDPKDPGIALMMQGYIITTWFDALSKLEEQPTTNKQEEI